MLFVLGQHYFCVRDVWTAYWLFREETCGEEAASCLLWRKAMPAYGHRVKSGYARWLASLEYARGLTVGRNWPALS